MDDEQHRQQAEQRREESALLKLQEEFHQFLHECQACQTRHRPALARLRSLRGTVGDALPRLRPPAPTGRRAGLRTVRGGTPAGPAMRPGPPRLFFHQHFKPVGACAGDHRARRFFPRHFIPAPFFNEGTSLVGN